MKISVLLESWLSRHVATLQHNYSINQHLQLLGGRVKGKISNLFTGFKVAYFYRVGKPVNWFWAYEVCCTSPRINPWVNGISNSVRPAVCGTNQYTLRKSNNPIVQPSIHLCNHASIQLVVRSRIFCFFFLIFF